MQTSGTTYNTSLINNKIKSIPDIYHMFTFSRYPHYKMVTKIERIESNLTRFSKNFTLVTTRPEYEVFTSNNSHSNSQMV